MCGIIGHFSVNGNFNAGKFAAANNMVKYRGPDDYGYMTIHDNFDIREWHDEHMSGFENCVNVKGAIGFRRLSIIDLTSRGHQPMADESGRYWIVMNGEVYNFVEIRDELTSLGYDFRSRTDTEVILKSYLEWGTDCLKRFNGMWAFCILDITKRRLFCARDRFGVKPFYYHFDGRHFIFGSEVKQVLMLKPNGAKMNHAVFFDYLALGSYGNETRETFFCDIFKLLPGEFLLADLSKPEEIDVRTEFWWDLPQLYGNSEISADDLYEEIRFLLTDSIRLRLRSDVPLGTCLSGGLDSSAIVCILDKMGETAKKGKRHKVFVIGSRDPRIDETGYAQIVIDKTNVEPHVKYPDSVDLASELEDFVWHHDEPLISASMFGGWHVYKLAKETGVTVVLDGQGSDELLGGYYFGAQIDYLSELLRKAEILSFFREFKSNAVLHNIGEATLFRNIIHSYTKQVGRFFSPSTFRPKVYRKASGWLTEDFIRANVPRSHVLMRDFYGMPRRFSSIIKKQSYEFIKFTSLPGILRQVDRNSMAFSVEARVPFLDYRLSEFLFKLPPGDILKNGYTKYAYRQAMKGIIPERIRLRTDKRGFAMPERQLLLGALPFIRSILERIPTSSAIYDRSGILRELEPSLSNDKLYTSIVWRIINAVVWQSRFDLSE